MNYNNFNSFCLYLIFTFGYILFGVEPYIPVGRYGHSSILVGNQVYFFGGVISSYSSYSASNEAFYLDLSQPFNATNPPWAQLNDLPFESAVATVVLDNLNNDLYLFGGLINDVNTQHISSLGSFNIYK